MSQTFQNLSLLTIGEVVDVENLEISNVQEQDLLEVLTIESTDISEPHFLVINKEKELVESHLFVDWDDEEKIKKEMQSYGDPEFVYTEISGNIIIAYPSIGKAYSVLPRVNAVRRVFSYTPESVTEFSSRLPPQEETDKKAQELYQQRFEQIMKLSEPDIDTKTSVSTRSLLDSLVIIIALLITILIGFLIKKKVIKIPKRLKKKQHKSNKYDLVAKD